MGITLKYKGLHRSAKTNVRNLKVAHPNDQYEKEADTIADDVMSMPQGPLPIQRKCAGCEEEELQMMPLQPSPAATIHRQNENNEEKNLILPKLENTTSNIGKRDHHLSTPQLSESAGRSMTSDTKKWMGSRMNADFSNVKIHTDTTSARMSEQLSAKAFTHGQNIYFNKGLYQPSTFNGKKLLAHELAHTLQPSPHVIRRTINLAKSNYLPNGEYVEGDEEQFINAIWGHHKSLESLIKGTDKVYEGVGKTDHRSSEKYRTKLVKDILNGLLSASDVFDYRNEIEVYDDVYKRAVSSLYMRTSQGTKTVKKVKYPESVGAMTNKEAAAYWNVTTGDQYKFELSATGKSDAYEALRTILFEAKSKVDTTRMHCDYVIGAIHYMAMAETMGIKSFNHAVKEGKIKVWLDGPDSFDHTVPDSIAARGDYGVKNAIDTSKHSIVDTVIKGESQIIIGDHVVFFNHSAYPSLNMKQEESWSLENALVIDKGASGKKFRFQGHGYSSPKDRASFITAMKNKYNTLLSRLAAVIASGDAFALSMEFPMVKPKTGITSSRKSRDHEIIYSKTGDASKDHWSKIPEGDRLPMEIRKVTSKDYPNPFASWGKEKEDNPQGMASIMVTRPLEGFQV